MIKIITATVLLFIGAQFHWTWAQRNVRSPRNRDRAAHTTAAENKKAVEPSTQSSDRARWRRRSAAIRSGNSRGAFERVEETKIPASPQTISTPLPVETTSPELVEHEPIRTETPTASSSITNTLPQPSGASPVTSAPVIMDEPLSPSNSDKNTEPSAGSAPVDPTTIYRVGVGDVLDIRLLNAPTNSSTLYTVQAGGVLEYALAGDPIVVGGMTTDEIDARITSELQRRSIQANPQVVVSVRDYASHTVLVSGLVTNPGGKILQRGAMPLYVVIADAQPRPEAAQVVLNSHTTGQSTIIDLADTAALNTLVRPGDVINVTAQTPQFYYIGGDIDVPGQKEFHAGITLTQAVLAAGGYLRAGKTVVEIARQGADGRLNALRYKLVDIMSGKIPDPRLQGGDRIEVYR